LKLHTHADKRETMSAEKKLQEIYPNEYAFYQKHKEANGVNYCEGLEDVFELMKWYAKKANQPKEPQQQSVRPNTIKPQDFLDKRGYRNCDVVYIGMGKSMKVDLTEVLGGYLMDLIAANTLNQDIREAAEEAKAFIKKDHSDTNTWFTRTAKRVYEKLEQALNKKP